MTLNTRLVELQNLLFYKNSFQSHSHFNNKPLPNPYTNEIIKFYYIICTFPVPNSLFSHFSPLFPSFHIFLLKNLFLLSRPTPIYVAKTKALISFAVTTKLICVFVFVNAKSWFSYDRAHIIFSSVWVAEWPPFGKELLTHLTIIYVLFVF